MLSRIGVVLHTNGDMDAALDAHCAARDACAELDEPVGQANALYYLGEIHMERGEFEEAFRDLRQGIEIYRGLGDNWNVAGGRYFLGAALRQAGLLPEARAELDAALAGYRELGDEFDEAGVLNQIGLLLVAAGHFDEAERALSEALRLYDEQSSPGGRQEVLNGQGELALARARSLARGTRGAGGGGPGRRPRRGVARRGRRAVPPGAGNRDRHEGPARAGPGQRGNRIRLAARRAPLGGGYLVRRGALAV